MGNADHSPISRYAAEVALLIDRVHEDFHRRAAAVFRQRGLERPPHAGVLITLRFALAEPDRALPLSAVKLAFRYSAPENVATAVTELAEAGWLHLTGELVRPTQRTVSWVNGLYDVQAEVATAPWQPAAADAVTTGALAAEFVAADPADADAVAADPAAADAADIDLAALAHLAGRLLTAAADTARPAFAALYPPYERTGDPSGLLLFNRLAVLRYHRADAHAAAWAAEGLTAQEMESLQPGELRERIEAETNRLAAPPFAALTEAERQSFLARLRALAG